MKRRNNSLRKKQFTGKQSGFTLIEIMIVIVIIASIMGIVGANLFDSQDKAKVSEAKIQMGSFEGALDLYRVDNKRYPSTEQGLKALIEKPVVGVIPSRWKGPYLNKKQKTVPKDPWDADYVYKLDGRDYTMMSLGPDGEEGNDDIIFGE